MISTTTMSSGKWLTSWLSLLAVTVLLILGLYLPMLTLSKFYFFNNSVSVISGVATLWAERHFGLFVVIGLFSVVLPLMKIAVLARVTWLLRPDAYREKSQIPKDKPHKLLGWMHAYGRWGMLDVFVVAVLIVTVKLRAIASVEIHSGLYFFGAAVLLLNIITHFLSKRAIAASH